MSLTANERPSQFPGHEEYRPHLHPDFSLLVLHPFFFSLHSTSYTNSFPFLVSSHLVSSRLVLSCVVLSCVVLSLEWFICCSREKELGNWARWELCLPYRPGFQNTTKAKVLLWTHLAERFPFAHRTFSVKTNVSSYKQKWYLSSLKYWPCW